MKESGQKPVTVVIGGVDAARCRAVVEVLKKRFPGGAVVHRVDVPVNYKGEFQTGFRAAEGTVRTMVKEAHNKVPNADFVVAVDTRRMGETGGKMGPQYFDRAVAMVKVAHKSKRGISRSSIGFGDNHDPTPAERHAQLVDAVEKAFDRV